MLLFLLAVTSGVSASSRQEEAAGELRCGIIYPVEKIRPGESVITGGEPSHGPLLIAGGEREALLFAVANSGNEPRIIRTLAVSTGHPKLSAAVYRVEYVDVSKPTPIFSRLGRKGRWPDPLIPLRESAGHNGGASSGSNTGGASATSTKVFQLPEAVAIPSGENRCFLIDLYLPPEGSGRGTARVSEADGAPQTATLTVTASVGFRRYASEIDIELLPFSLPEKQRLTTAFGFKWSEVQYKHRQLSDASFERAALHRDYLRQLAIDRIAPFMPWRNLPEVSTNENGAMEIDWSGFDAVVGSLLDGELFHDTPAATSLVFPYPAKDVQGKARAEFYPEAVRHLKENGWLEKSFYYLPDEPLRSQYDEVRERAEGFAARAPGVRRLVTEPFTESLAGYVEIWCPDVIAIGDTFAFFPAYFKSDGLHLDRQVNVDPEKYAERQELGEEVWFYTSTASQIGNYPNLFIDYPAAYARIIPWIAYLYGFTGVLHWETSYDYRGRENPWASFFNFYSNGDGNLLYPGLPGEFGLEEHSALPSIRLILFREGVEDFEYLSLAADTAGREDAMAIVKTMASASVRWQEDPEKFYAAKQRIARMISGVRPE